MDAPLGTLGASLLPAVGVGYALGAVVLFTLKNAAQRGRLGASTFRALNIGGPSGRAEGEASRAGGGRGGLARVGIVAAPPAAGGQNVRLVNPRPRALTRRPRFVSSCCPCSCAPSFQAWQSWP